MPNACSGLSGPLKLKKYITKDLSTSVVRVFLVAPFEFLTPDLMNPKRSYNKRGQSLMVALVKKEARIYLIREVLLNDLIGQLVDLDVLVVLQALDLVEAAAALDHLRHRVHLFAGELQNVVDAVKDNLKKANNFHSDLKLITACLKHQIRRFFGFVIDYAIRVLNCPWQQN